jgi:Putative transposase, YhgA-like
MSNLTVTKDLLQAHVSPSITRRIHWGTLRLGSKSYTDEKLAQLHSDVVYACQIDDKSTYTYIARAGDYARPFAPLSLLTVQPSPDERSFGEQQEQEVAFCHHQPNQEENKEVCNKRSCILLRICYLSYT